MRRLPRHDAVLGDTVDGRVIHLTLTRPGPARMPAGATGVAVLDVPADPAQYTDGASKQTLRRKSRSAVKGGATWRPVDDPAERRLLLDLAHAAEAAHPDAQYRVERPELDPLLEHDLWLAAFDGDGTPLMLSVTPHDGEWAHLRYFRTLGSSPLHSDTRYLMTQALVETLARLGVRHLMDGVHPVDLPNGLRHFQRMVGFRVARVHARLTTAEVADPSPAEPALAPLTERRAGPGARKVPPMTWLVTGGAGYIGAHVVAAMREAGADVVVLDDLSTGDPGRIAGVPFVERRVLDGALRRADARASTTSPAWCTWRRRSRSRSPSASRCYYYRENVEGLRVLLEAATAAGVESFVFSSSAAVYGAPDVELVDEDVDVPAGQPVRADQARRRAAGGRRRRRHRAALRQPALLQRGRVRGAGAGRPRRAPTSCRWCSSGSPRGRPPLIFGADYPTPDGTCIRDFVHVADIASAHVAAARGPGRRGGSTRADGEHRPRRGRLGAGDGATDPRGHRHRGRGLVRARGASTGGAGDPARVVASRGHASATRSAGQPRFGVERDGRVRLGRLAALTSTAGSRHGAPATGNESGSRDGLAPGRGDWPGPATPARSAARSQASRPPRPASRRRGSRAARPGHGTR